MADSHLTPREQSDRRPELFDHHGRLLHSPRISRRRPGLGKRHVLDAVNRLEAKGYYSIERGTQDATKGTKNSISRYRPNPEEVPSGAPFTTAAQMYQLRRYEEKRFPCAPEKVPRCPEKGSPKGTEYGLRNTAFKDEYGSHYVRASRSQNDDALTDPHFVVLKKLRSYDAWLKAGSNRALTPTERRTLEGWLEYCDEICDRFDSHTGDPIGGMAYRLAQDLAYELDNAEIDRERQAADDRETAARTLERSRPAEGRGDFLRRDFPNEPWSVQDAATTAAIELLKDPERTKEFQAIVGAVTPGRARAASAADHPRPGRAATGRIASTQWPFAGQNPVWRQPDAARASARGRRAFPSQRSSEPSRIRPTIWRSSRSASAKL